MDQKRAKKLLPLITAFAQGKMIQFRPLPLQDWETTSNPQWSDKAEYRIKPSKSRKPK